MVHAIKTSAGIPADRAVILPARGNEHSVFDIEYLGRPLIRRLEVRAQDFALVRPQNVINNEHRTNHESRFNCLIFLPYMLSVVPGIQKAKMYRIESTFGHVLPQVRYGVPFHIIDVSVVLAARMLALFDVFRSQFEGEKSASLLYCRGNDQCAICTFVDVSNTTRFQQNGLIEISHDL